MSATTCEGRRAMTPGERAMWVRQCLVPDSDEFNILVRVRIFEAVDRERMQAAVDAMLADQPALRVRVEASGEPALVVERGVELELGWHDCRGHERSQLRRAVDRLRASNLPDGHGSLVRVDILDQGDRAWLVFVAHHLIVDFRGVDLLAHGLLRRYAAPGSVGDACSAETMLDYGSSLGAWLESRAALGSLEERRAALAGAPEGLRLRDLAQSGAREDGGGRVLEFGVEETRRLRAAARRGRVTLSMWILGALHTALSGYVDQNEIVTGVTVDRRGKTWSNTIGYMVNQFLLRSEISPREPFARLLAGLKSSWKRAQVSAGHPVEALIEALAPRRVGAQHPLFQVALNSMPSSRLDWRFTDLALDSEERAASGSTVEALDHGPVAYEQSQVQCDLVVNVLSRGDRVFVHLRHRRGVLGRPRLDGIAERFDSILRAPQATESAPSLLDLRFSDSAERAPRDTTTFVSFMDMFFDHARARPDSVALCWSGGHWSYGELARRVEQMARALREGGLRAEDRIGVEIGPEPRWIVATLAIWAAGGVYVAIDPRLPTSRRDALMHAASFAGIVRPAADDDQLRVDWSARPAEDSGSVTRHIPGPTSAAYGIFTSGTTGRPKLVVNTHGGLAELARAHGRMYGIDPRSRVFQFSASSFDASIFEMTQAFGHGARLQLPRRAAPLPDSSFVEQLSAGEISHLTVPPSFLRTLPDAKLPSLQQIVVAGEACDAEVLRRWAPGRRFYNAYGPSETTVCATNGQLSVDDEPSCIGRAIAGAEVYLLDSQGAWAAPGVVGELFVAGGLVARGYHADPRHTAERFVPDPFSEIPGARMYRTGDHAYRDSTGRLVFVGRIDHQVKIRGHRIELEAVEAAASAIPGVDRSVALVAPDDANALVVVVSVRPSHALDAADVTRALGAALPTYMVPQRCLVWPSLPQLTSGKVDRSQVRERAAADSCAKRDGRRADTAETVTGERVREIWQDVLGLSSCDPKSGFFELGGHSLSLAELKNRLESELDRKLDIVDFFANPSLEALIACLANDGDLAANDGGDARVERLVDRKRSARRARSIRARTRKAAHG